MHSSNSQASHVIPGVWAMPKLCANILNEAYNSSRNMIAFFERNIVNIFSVVSSCPRFESPVCTIGNAGGIQHQTIQRVFWGPSWSPDVLVVLHRSGIELFHVAIFDNFLDAVHLHSIETEQKVVDICWHPTSPSCLLCIGDRRRIRLFQFNEVDSKKVSFVCEIRAHVTDSLSSFTWNSDGTLLTQVGGGEILAVPFDLNNLDFLDSSQIRTSLNDVNSQSNNDSKHQENQISKLFPIIGNQRKVMFLPTCSNKSTAIFCVVCDSPIDATDTNNPPALSQISSTSNLNDDNYVVDLTTPKRKSVRHVSLCCPQEDETKRASHRNSIHEFEHSEKIAVKDDESPSHQSACLMFLMFESEAESSTKWLLTESKTVHIHELVTLDLSCSEQEWGFTTGPTIAVGSQTSRRIVLFRVAWSNSTESNTLKKLFVEKLQEIELAHDEQTKGISIVNGQLDVLAVTHQEDEDIAHNLSTTRKVSMKMILFDTRKLKTDIVSAGLIQINFSSNNNTKNQEEEEEKKKKMQSKTSQTESSSTNNNSTQTQPNLSSSSISDIISFFQRFENRMERLEQLVGQIHTRVQKIEENVEKIKSNQLK